MFLPQKLIFNLNCQQVWFSTASPKMVFASCRLCKRYRISVLAEARLVSLRTILPIFIGIFSLWKKKNFTVRKHDWPVRLSSATEYHFWNGCIICEACKQSEPLLALIQVTPHAHRSKHTLFLFLVVSQRYALCRTCHPLQPPARYGWEDWEYVAGGAKWYDSGGRRTKKMRVTVLKLALGEKVTDDLMLAVTRRLASKIRSSLTSPSSSSFFWHEIFVVPHFLLKISQLFSLLKLEPAHVNRLGSDIQLSENSVHPICSLKWRWEKT